ncbi:MAG: circadian clock KaiB family protein [Chloroflexota bacterium]
MIEPSEEECLDKGEPTVSETSAEDPYILHLYVTGTTPRSTQAILKTQHFCEEHLHGRYELEVIDIYQQPELARQAEVIAAPTLIKNWPPPSYKLVGNLSNLSRIMVVEDL